ncbi:ShlB/FhaC/HecB family hemolysin secretion/activation protein [Leptolyngbya sp. NIES-2104]|uniref:ShlB/FhaC/HecB family hemolysin secretion/activation protein n=1 Tax=Leptolyngbya sp. NIES-2104 TaxID=1552121 RepID=UPI0006EC8AB6|nr:ShlB/FhaC/HecB family hemolysin secretion/activation protein [Leptolyngbya sp. NIES-2104]GAP99579.1 hemolysin activation/secretion protein [Leptolyngbya sp. NIES-2104]
MFEDTVLLIVIEAQSLPPQPIPNLNLPPATPATPPPLLPRVSPPEIINSPSSQPESQTSSPRSIRVKEFRFQGNTVFTQQQLGEVVANFIGRDISIAELLQTSAAIRRFYTDRGYLVVGAFIPEAANEALAPQAAIVTIQVVEGTVEQIRVTGDDRFARYVRSRLERATRPILQEQRLIEALRLLQADPRIRTISAVLNPGTEPNTRVLEVQIATNQTFNGSVELNNQRSQLVGRLERRIDLKQANLLEFGDDLSLFYANTDGSNTVGTTYTIPVNVQNGTVQLSATWLNSRIIEEPFDESDIRSSSAFYDLTFRQPIVQRATEESIQELALGITASHSESRSSILGVSFPLSPGADDQGRTRISAIRLFQEWTQRSDRSVLAARSQFSFGINALNSTINRDAPDSQFLSWRGQALWLQRVNSRLDILLRSQLQFSDRVLVPTEQFSLGGSSTVRGYAQNAALNDNGIFGSAEFRIGLLLNDSTSLLLIPFVDAGRAWNSNGNDPNTLASLGLGLQWIQNGLQVRANYAFPLTTLDNQNSQANQFDFSVQYNFSF